MNTSSCFPLWIHYYDKHRLIPQWVSPDVKATFSPGLSQSGQNKGTMIPAMIQPFQTKLSHSAECQHKFADIFSFLSVSRRSLIHLHNPCDTAINNSSVICISMPEIEDRHAHSKYSPARNKLPNVVLTGRGMNVEYSQGSITLRQTLLTVYFLTLHLQSFS